MDFVSYALANGRRIKGVLTIVDDFSKEAIDLVVDLGISGHYVTRVLDQAARFRATPRLFEPTRGPEFTGKALDQWACQHGVQLKLIQAGKPTQRTRSSRASMDASGMNAELPSVHELATGSYPDRRLAPRLQPASAAQRIELSNPGRIRGPEHRANTSAQPATEECL